MNWLQLSDADRVAAVNVATRQLGFNANVIEKDWWVVMALKAPSSSVSLRRISLSL